MNYLITKNGYDFLYRIDNYDCVFEETFDEHLLIKFIHEDDIDLKCQLPLELRNKIILTTFWEMISSRNFAEAYKMATLDHASLIMIYRSVFTVDCCREIMIDSLGFVLRFAECVQADYLQFENPSMSPTVGVRLVTSICFQGEAGIFLRPWDFSLDSMDFSSFEGRLLITNGKNRERFHAWQTGPTYGENVWTVGRRSGGQYHCKKLYYPVITLILTDITGVLLPSLNEFPNNRYFKQMSEFLKLCFGPSTGVFFMVKKSADSGNIFISSTSLLLSF